MKSIDKSVNTIPFGAWEAGQTDDSLRSCHKTSAPTNVPEKTYPPQKEENSVEPLPESTRPRKDGPGGD